MVAVRVSHENLSAEECSHRVICFHFRNINCSCVAEKYDVEPKSG
jgi:hypothetical protein